MVFDFNSSKTVYKMNVKEFGKYIKMLIGDKLIGPSTNTAVEEVIKTVGQTASKIIERGGNIITAPATWLKAMQQNWLTYMIVIAIILSTVTFLYCASCCYLNRAKTYASNCNLVELAKVISERSGILQQLSVPALKLRSPPAHALP